MRILWLLLLCGCATAGARAPTDNSTLYVKNQSQYDVRLYSARNGSTHRIGRVTALSDEKWDLKVSDLSMGSLSLLLEVTRGKRFRLDDISVYLPMDVYLTILYPFQFSYWRTEQ